MSLTWLHLTDLHLGLRAQDNLFDNVKFAFLDDVRRQMNKIGGEIDLILFTGDLVQRGDRGEFDRFEDLMLELRARMKSYAPAPVFLAIPGNHDLVRPRSAADAAVAGLLRCWQRTQEPSVQDHFWEESASSQRKVVEAAFQNYRDWWNKSALNPSRHLRGDLSLPCVRNYRNGLLPGDFSCVVVKNALRLGVMGLNSTFLQLLGGDFQGKLSVGLRQVREVCPGGLTAWLNAAHLSLLLTHQPPDWLTAEARKTLDEEINPPGRFALHLFGHMHETASTATRFGNGVARCQQQGRSLFGMEYVGEAGTIVRSHGYSLGRIEAMEENNWRVKTWPRRAEQIKSVGVHFIADYAGGVLQDESFLEFVHAGQSRALAVRRLQAADAEYFADCVYPLLQAEMGPDELKPLETMLWWLREPHPEYPDYFLVAEAGGDPVGFLYFGPMLHADLLILSYLVVREGAAPNPPGSVSSLLLVELWRIFRETGRSGLVMEIADPGDAGSEGEWIRRLARLKLFGKFAGEYGFDCRALDVHYLQPPLSLEKNAVPNLLVLARDGAVQQRDLPRQQVEQILRTLYDTYPFGYSQDAGEVAKFTEICAELRDKVLSGLPERVPLLNHEQMAKKTRPSINKAVATGAGLATSE